MINKTQLESIYAILIFQRNGHKGKILLALKAFNADSFDVYDLTTGEIGKDTYIGDRESTTILRMINKKQSQYKYKTYTYQEFIKYLGIWLPF